LLDVTYESIKAMPGSGVYELRIDDELGGLRNIRVVFFEAPQTWKPNTAYPRPVLWVLEALPKKRQDWTANDIDRFRAKRAVVKARFYDPATTKRHP
jgi:hypothetical protein